MALREVLSRIPNPRAQNRRYSPWGFLALILVVSPCHVGFLRGVEGYERGLAA